MAELMHFQPGKTFYDAYQGARGNTLAGLAMNSQGEQRQSALAQLAGIDAGAAQEMKKGLDDQDRAELAEFSNVIMNVPDEMKPQVYAKGVQRFGSKFRDLGIEPPADYTQAMPLFQQFAGGGQNQGVQSTFVSGGNLHYLTRDGRSVDTGRKVDDRYTPIIDPVTGEVKGYGRGSNQLVPTGTGETTTQKPQGQTVEVPVGLVDSFRQEMGRDPTIAEINEMKGVILQKEGAGYHFTDMPRPASGQAPAQTARINPKPTAEPAPKTAVAYDKDGNMIIVDASKPGIVPGAVRPGSQMSGAQVAKRQDAARKEKAALDSANQQTDDTVRNIDSLTSSGLEGTVGTFGFLSNIPGTDWADKKAKITTLTARAAFGALQEMRQNSPTGGALGGIAVQELLLLQNAQTQLERAQSPEAFKAALVEFKKALLQTKTRVNRAYAEHYGQDGQGAPQAPQNDDDAMINKYLD